MDKRFDGIRAVTLCALTALAVPHLTAAVAPQAPPQRHEDWEWSGNYQRLTRINPGTFVTVRTAQAIQSDRTDGRIFSGAVAEDVWDDYRRLAVPAIPRGSRVDLVVRTARDGDLILDMESIYAHGHRYAVDAAPERLEGNRRGPDEGDAAKYVGGGAILGTIIGSIAGGGKGAAIGAATGAAAGLGGLAFQGRSIRVPAGSHLTFRLEQGLTLDVGEGDRRGPHRTMR